MGASPDSPWAPLRRAQRIGWALWLSYIPGVVAIGSLLANTLHGLAYLTVAFAWMGAAMFLMYRAGQFRCPRCGAPFYRVWWYQRSWANNCAHCGLSKWADFQPID